MPRTNRIFYGWIVVAVTTLVLLTSAGVRSAPGVFLLPVQASMHWERATLAFAASLGLLLYGLAGPFSGWLMSRFNLRWITVVGLVLISTSMIASLWISEPWHLTLIWGVFSGIGTGMIGSVLSAAIAARWFIAHRGLVVGIFGAAISAGQLIFVPLLMRFNGTIGWRNGSLILGLIAGMVIVPVALLLRDDPSELGLRPLGASETQPIGRSKAETGVMGRALRSPAFWLLSATFFVCGATSNGLIGTHLIPYAIECGIPEVAAASSLAILGAMNFLGTMASGWLTDRYDPRRLLLIFYCFRGISLLCLPFARDPLTLSLFAAVFGLDYIATVPPTTALIADIFGRRNVGIVYGWVFCAHQLGAALAAWLGGIARDQLGNYTLAFIVAGIIALLAGTTALMIKRTSTVPAPVSAL